MKLGQKAWLGFSCQLLFFLQFFIYFNDTIIVVIWNVLWECKNTAAEISEITKEIIWIVKPQTGSKSGQNIKDFVLVLPCCQEGALTYSCIVISKQGPTDPICNMDIFNSGIVSPLCQEGQSERTFLIFAFSSWFFLSLILFPLFLISSLFFPIFSWISPFSWFLANLLLLGALCPLPPPTGYTTDPQCEIMTPYHRYSFQKATLCIGQLQIHTLFTYLWHIPSL